MATYATFTASGGETQFDVSFPYLRFSDLVVTVDDKVVTATEVRPGRIELAVAATAGQTVQIQRQTDVSSAIEDFQDPASWTGDSLNRADNQNRYAIEELKFDLLNLDTSGGTGELPSATGLNQFLVSTSSGPGYAFTIKSLAQVQSILGVSAIVPAPVAGNKILTTQFGAAAYQLSTPAELKTILGLPSVSLPEPTNQFSKILATNSGGTGYQFLSASDLSSMLNLGSAAQQNYGTSANQLVRLDGAGKLPAVDGSQLTGIATTNQYCRVVSSKASNFSTSADGVYRNPGAGVMSISVGPTGSAWATCDGTSVTLQPGRYLISIEQYYTCNYATFGSPVTGALISVIGRVQGTSGTMTPTNTYSPAETLFRPTDTNPSCGGFVGGVLRMNFGIDVTATATFNFSVAAINTLNSSGASLGVRHTTLPDNTNQPASTRMHIWKIN